MITPHTTPAYDYAVCSTTLDAGLKKDSEYQVIAWHGQRVCVLASGAKHWTKSSYFEPKKKNSDGTN